MSFTINEIKKKLSRIKQMGYVRSLRKGPTGIGYTLETLLGIDENNISAPDLGHIELKAHREKHTGMLTLCGLLSSMFTDLYSLGIGDST